MNKIYQNDVGKDLRIDTFVDLATATVLVMRVLTSTGETEWAASAVSGDTGALTVLRYVTVAGDLAVSGIYALQAYVEWGSGSKHLGEPVRFTCYEKFEPSG